MLVASQPHREGKLSFEPKLLVGLILLPQGRRTPESKDAKLRELSVVRRVQERISCVQRGQRTPWRAVLLCGVELERGQCFDALLKWGAGRGEYTYSLKFNHQENLLDSTLSYSLCYFLETDGQ